MMVFRVIEKAIFTTSHFSYRLYQLLCIFLYFIRVAAIPDGIAQHNIAVLFQLAYLDNNVQVLYFKTYRFSTNK